MSIVNKQKAIADIITPPAGYKTLFFRSDTGVPAVKDENGVVSDLVIPGDASGVTFTPQDAHNWTDSVDPGNVDDALNDLAVRVNTLEEAEAPDAQIVTYTPTTAADWDGDVDPGDAQEAFDQLAERVTDLEEAPVVSDASLITYEPSNSLNWTDSEDPGNVDDALDDLAARVQSLEENPGGGGNSFGTIAVSGQSNVVAEQENDTLTLVAGTNVTITTDAATDAVTINATGGNSFGTVAVSGQSNVVADAAPDTLTLVAGSGITITTDAGADSITITSASGAAVITQCIAVACSDETTALTTGTAKATFRMPYAMTLTSVKATVTTAPTGASLLTVDINKTGVGSILSTVITIDASEKTSATAATPPVISTSSLSADDEITIDIDQVGSTIAGAGLKVYLIGTVAGSVSVDASTVTFTPSNSLNWTDSEDPGDVDDALNDLAARVQAVEENPGGGSGAVVQIVNTQTGAVATGTGTIPVDDTIPQNTEGTEFMTLAITPTSATNKLKIEVVGYAGSSSAAPFFMAMALFQDSNANALAVQAKSVGTATHGAEISLTHYMTAGTTSATTFKVRMGANGAGTTTFNGLSAGRLYGGVMASSITITEYVP